MKHLIMGTAGHVDHGKTALVRTLTGTDCDTHPEEKIRGITINLGFAHYELPDGGSIGIVDVPGHRDFVNTMVAGAHGIDFVLLVIAADGGVMPQTVEHLRIMETLNVQEGLVIITKTDLVDEELLFMAEEEVQGLLKGTFLENKPVLKVSAVSGDGIRELRSVLAEIVLDIENRPPGEVFRMFIDRIFSVKGFGTVVTGSVHGGRLAKDGKVYLLPGGEELRIRRLERHGIEVDEICAGDRAAINVVGLRREEYHRGMLLSDRELPSTVMIDANLRLFNVRHRFDLWTQVVFLTGAYQGEARIHLIDQNNLDCGQTAIVQIHLDTPCVVQQGDRYVIRSDSNDATLGGGLILDAHPLHHRRRPEKLIRELKKISSGDLTELVAAEVRKCRSPLSHTYIGDVLNVPREEIGSLIPDSLPKDIVALVSGEDVILLTANLHSDIHKRILRNLEIHHRRNPLEQAGRTFEELAALTGSSRTPASDTSMKCILRDMQNARVLKRLQHTWALETHTVSMTEEEQKQISYIEHYLKRCGMQTPLMSEMQHKAAQHHITESRLRQILQYLTRRNSVYKIDDNFLHRTIVDKCRNTLLSTLADTKNGFTVAEFRDTVQGNRKICLLLLTLFDSEKITVRDGDLRFLTESGRERAAIPSSDRTRED